MTNFGDTGDRVAPYDIRKLSNLHDFGVDLAAFDRRLVGQPAHSGAERSRWGREDAEMNAIGQRVQLAARRFTQIGPPSRNVHERFDQTWKLVSR